MRRLRKRGRSLMAIRDAVGKAGVPITLEEARVRFTEIVDVDTEWGMSPGDDDAV